MTSQPKIGEVLDWIIQAGWSNLDLHNAVMQSRSGNIDFRFVKLAMFRKLMTIWLPLVDALGSATLVPLEILYNRHGDTLGAWFAFQFIIVIGYIILMVCIASIDDQNSRRY